MNLVNTSITFSCAVLVVGNGVFEVHSPLADTHLGGYDFNKVEQEK